MLKTNMLERLELITHTHSCVDEIALDNDSIESLDED